MTTPRSVNTPPPTCSRYCATLLTILGESLTACALLIASPSPAPGPIRTRYDSETTWLAEIGPTTYSSRGPAPPVGSAMRFWWGETPGEPNRLLPATYAKPRG